jgi:phosphoribosyl-ATP pyrophosphohydrolase
MDCEAGCRAGMPKAAKKLGEEAVETVIAATSQTTDEN